MHFLLLWTIICPIQRANAQISHGGYPLAQGAEQTSKLRSTLDYFVEMPSFNLDSVLAIDNLSGNRAGGLKFAHKFFVDLTPENSGIVFQTEDGTKVWKLGIKSSGAYSINILFNKFDLPEGARVFLYNTDRSTVIGSLTKENCPDGKEFSVSPINGDELTIEYHEPANADFSGKIQITEVNHDYRGLFRVGTNSNAKNFPCIPDLSCNSQYDTIGRSVCLLIINGDTYCTGTLINNTANDGTPYLLTASHCFGGNYNNNNDSTRTEWGKRVVAFLNYGAPRCDSRIRGSEDFSVSGSTIKAISKEIDFALLKLTETPPLDYRPYLAGWSLDTITSTGLPFTCIQHPGGGLKKYCEEEDSVTRADWTEGSGIEAGNHWNIKKWEIGHTWGGSSGASLLDKNNHIRGGLTGGDSGGSYGCGTYVYGDYFFRFDRAWNNYSDSSKQLKHWLDPLTADGIQSPVNLDGLDPYAQNPAERINNLMSSDSLGEIYLQTPMWGSLFGHNSFGATTFAEHFTTANSSKIHGVYIVPAKGHNNSTSPVTVRIYKGESQPDSILGEAILNPNYQEYKNGIFTENTVSDFTNKEIYLRFDSAISVGTDFFVGYEIAYPIVSSVDSFYLYAAIRNSTSNNTAYVKQDGLWCSYSNYSNFPTNTSLWIEPVISSEKGNNSDTTVIKKPLIYYSYDGSLLSISLPVEWDGNTNVEIFDFTGRKILESTFSPPIGTIKLSHNQGRFFIIRIRNKKLVRVFKMFAGK